MTNFTDAWGFTKLSVFEECKAKFKYQFMDKLDSGGSPAMERGSKMHDNIEAYLNGWTPDLLPENMEFKENLDSLKTKNYKAEQALGFDKGWMKLPTWFGKDVWLRVKMDASYIEDDHGHAIDFKSGKYRVPSIDQVEIYAIGLYSANPALKEVTAQFWFLDTGEVYTKNYTAAELIKLREKYERRVVPMYTTTEWVENPSMGCRYCPYSKTKGGPCKY